MTTWEVYLRQQTQRSYKTKIGSKNAYMFEKSVKKKPTPFPLFHKKNLDEKYNINCNIKQRNDETLRE